MNRYLIRLFIIGFVIVVIMPQAFYALLGGLAKINLQDPMSTFTSSPDPVLTPARKNHILYGDKTGGGHIHGLGRACKSEFPADWDAQEIETIILKTAANDNLKWQEQGNGLYVADATENEIVIRIVIDKVDNQIITAYPVNTPRNPCPNPANDK